MRRGAHRGRVLAALAALTLAALALLAPGGASAAEGATTPFGPKFCLSGEGAGQCNFARGAAVSPVSGDLYVADLRNHRVNEFTAWGEFVRAFGWGVRDGSAELQACTTEIGCQKGLQGGEPGEFENPAGVAVDSVGDIYVSDPNNHRVEKFTPTGEFLLMFGGEVDQGPNHPGNLCTATYIAEGDTCGAGTAGNADGQFASSWSLSNILAVGPGDEVYVGGSERIQVFDSEGEYQRWLALPEPGTVGELAVDPSSGDLYMGYPNGRNSDERTLPNVRRLNHLSGEVLDELEAQAPAALATDAEGDVFVFDQFYESGASSDPANHSTRILRFDETGELVETIGEVEAAAEELKVSLGIASGSHCFGEGEAGFYVVVRNQFHTPEDFVQAYGPHPDPLKCAPPTVPPSIDAQFAATAASHSVTVAAQINPHYFTPPIGATAYRVQWATAACIEAGGWEAPCVSESAEAELESEEPVNEDLTTPAIALSGLASGAEYRYRFIAEGSGEPGEAIGVGGKPGEPGEEGSFATYPAPAPSPACANDSLRPGAAANLPDCRAYELVSPLDKAGGDIQARLTLVNFPARMDQAASSGESLTYSSYRAFGDAQSAPFSSQYLAQRDPATGWRSEAISPPKVGESFINELFPIENPFRVFGADLGTGWLFTDSEPVLGAGGLAGHPNLYRRQSASGAYEACTSSPPQLSEENTQLPQLQGTSADGSLGVFRDENKLTEDASEATKGEEPGKPPIYQLYACTYPPGGGAGTLRLISALPNGEASTLENTVGGPANQAFQSDQGRTETLQNAVSADGGEVFWTASSFNDAVGPGALYVRLNPAEPPTASGFCTGGAEASRACTLRISPGPARFWLAARDGSRAIYTDSGNLYEYSLASKASTRIAGEAIGVLGASEDASVVYYLAEEAEAEAEAEGAVAGQPNLYRYEAGGETKFVAVLSEQDASDEKGYPSPVNPRPAFHTARVSGDGQTLAFMSSSASLSEQTAGYDNTDQGGGSPAAEVYRYSVSAGLACVSCNRSGARPRGREVQESSLTPLPLYAAAMLPPWLNSLYAPRDLSEDGSRVFFESFEPLALSDTNGRADVYEWEAFGAGSCTDKSASPYVAKSNGCLYLISSGESSTDSEFVDASPDGHDVFIRTASSLVPWDPGQIDIYDARVGGGFPEPPASPAPCEGEACQPAASAPGFSSPASASFRGPGDASATPSPFARCTKSARRAKRLSRQARRLRRDARRMARGRGNRVRTQKARAAHRKAERYATAARKRSHRARRCRARVRKSRRAAG